MICIQNAADAANQDFATAIGNAEGIFITGGDQAKYAGLWGGDGLIRGAINSALARGAVIGGTSAGLAILGNPAFTAQGPTGTLKSSAALSGSADATAETTHAVGFLDVPLLAGVVTETHVQPEDKDPQGRIGRLYAFLEAFQAQRGIAVSAATAVLVEAGGGAQVVGRSPAYFLTGPVDPPAVVDGVPLTWGRVKVVRVVAGGTFNLSDWTGGPAPYYVTATDGRLSVEGSNDIY